MSFQAAGALTALSIMVVTSVTWFVALLLDERFSPGGAHLKSLAGIRLARMLGFIQLLPWEQWSNWLPGSFAAWLACLRPGARPDAAAISCFSSSALPYRAFPLSCCLLE
jgi:hypothetical protein